MNTLTREQVLAMEAGKEMNALIAESVMAWQRRRRVHPGETDPHGYWLTWPDTPHTHFPVAAPGARRHVSGLTFVPRYSADIAAAWEVVEHLYASGVTSECGNVLVPHDGPEGAWYCALLRPPVRLVALAPTPPLAICRAALRLTLTESQ